MTLFSDRSFCSKIFSLAFSIQKAFTKDPQQKTQAPRRMSNTVETDMNRSRTREGEGDDDKDGVPAHLKCAVCLGEGRDVCPPRAREPTRIRVPLGCRDLE